MRFVLVHGGCMGAWAWDLLVPELRSRGHEPIAIDLPGHGERRDERATLAGYRDAVVDVLQPGDVLVGHSMGCGVATMAADAFPEIAHICYLNGPLPVEGQVMSYTSGALRTSDGSVQLMAHVEGGVDAFTDVAPDGPTFTYTYQGARAGLFHDCQEAVFEWAFARLTPQRTDVLVAERISVPTFWAADLPRSFIRCTEDRAFPRQLSAIHVARLGVEELTIPTSHSPFLSRPSELADLLLHATKTRAVGPLLPQLG
jgi:pimeloyl-ACP methyl ester carboxylesterase